MTDFPQKILDAWNDRDWDRIVALHHPDYVEHLQSPDMPQGLDGLKMFFDIFTTAFPDYKIETGEVASGDGVNVGYHWVVRGTHTGDFMGMPASGNTFEMHAMTLLKEVDGKCKESWSVMDMAGLMAQLGAGG